jgi:AcrB/AcrD/AcrF family
LSVGACTQAPSRYTDSTDRCLISLQNEGDFYLHEALDRKLASGAALQRADIEEAAIEGAVQRLRPKLMTVAAVLASLVPILWTTGIGSDVMKPIAAPIVGGMMGRPPRPAVGLRWRPFTASQARGKPVENLG